MAISRPKGVSKREMAASKVGGKLNYSTGKISVPVKAPVKQTRATSSYSMNPEDAPQTTAQFESRIASGLGGTESVNAAKKEAQLTSSPSKQKEASNRMKAAKAVTVSLAPTVQNIQRSGIDTSGTISSPKPTNFLSDLMGKVGRMWANNGLYQASPGTFMSPQQKQANINEGLGIESANASGPSALENVLQKSSIPDQPTGYGPNGEIYYNNFDPASEGAMLFQSDFATPGTNFSRPGSVTAYDQGQSPIDYGMKQRAEAVSYGSHPTTQISRAPRQTTATPTAPLTTLISQVVNHPDFPAQPDYTPVNHGQAGTQRQFLGNGMLSSGIASNGKLDSGIEGFSFGAPMDTEENLINQLLGIQTAQAQEMPQQNFSFGDNVTPVSAFQYGFANGGLTGQMPQQFGQGTMNPTISDTQNLTTRTDRRDATVHPSITAPVRQTAAPAPASSPAMDYQKQSLKSFSAQEKAQKRALKELIKSIKNQYSTKQQAGLQDLEKAKQNDLLKLSGLFSFANQDPSSEQRIQYEQRANQDYAGQIGDFLAKLAAAMSGDISQANQGYQGKLADINSQRNTAQYNIAQLLQKAQDDAASRALKGSGTAGSVTFLGNDANGNPVFRNNKTGVREIGTGLTRPSNSITPQLQQDENGNWYYEQ